MSSRDAAKEAIKKRSLGKSSYSHSFLFYLKIIN